MTTPPGLPAHGRTRSEIFDDLQSFRANDLNWRSGRVFGYVYDAGADAEAIGKAAYLDYLGENGLDPTVFPSLLRLETAIVSTVAAHVGDANAVGHFTSGGTESILLAVKAARDLARARGVRSPRMILPATAHAAFHKAAAYLGVAKDVVEVDPVSFRALPAAIEAAIGPDTALVVCSAPSYAHGVVDPVEAIAAIAAAAGVPCHVDACVGGWLLPFMRRCGWTVPAFGLDVPGVTSISVDLHKYALCPKGASVVLYRDPAMRTAQTFACAGWTGYTVVNPTVQSSKTGGPLAGAWATLQAIGDDGYLERAQALCDATRTLVAGLAATPGIRVLGRPDFCMAAIAGEPLRPGDAPVSVFHIADEMKARGWYVQPQLGFGPSPANIHFSLNPGNVGAVSAMLDDLQAAVLAAAALPTGELVEALHAMLGDESATALGPDAVAELMAAVGVQGALLPERLAGINEVLQALPPDAREALLIGFFGVLYRGPAAGQA